MQRVPADHVWSHNDREEARMQRERLTYQETKHLCGTHFQGLAGGVNPGYAEKYLPSFMFTVTMFLPNRNLKTSWSTRDRIVWQIQRASQVDGNPIRGFTQDRILTFNVSRFTKCKFARIWTPYMSSQLRRIRHWWGLQLHGLLNRHKRLSGEPSARQQLPSHSATFGFKRATELNNKTERNLGGSTDGFLRWTFLNGVTVSHGITLKLIVSWRVSLIG